jgi:hypothetical protein
MNEENGNEPTSGLQSLSNKPAQFGQPQPAPIAPERMVTKETIDPLTKAKIEYDGQRREINATIRSLIEGLEARISGPQDLFMALAQGFGAPTRGGSFGESLSNALGGVSAVQKERRGIETDLAKMKLDLSSRELEQSKDNMLSGAISQLSGQGGQGGQGGMNLSPQAAQMVRIASVLDPKSAITNLLKFTLDESKSAEAVKALNAYISMLPPEQQAEAKAFAARSNIYGRETDIVTAEKTIRDLVAAQRISPEEGNARIASLRGQGAPSAAPSAPSTPANLPSANLQGDPRNIFAQIDQHPDPAIREEMRQAYIRQLSEQKPATPFVPKTENQLAVERVTGETKAKADVERKAKSVQSFSDQNDQSSSNIRTADQIYKIVEKNPGGFGIFSKPGWQSAIGQLAETGIRVGPYNVSIADIRGAMLRSGEFSQEEINAVSQVEQLAIQQQLAIAAGEKGSASNLERALFAQAVINTSDNPKMIQYKAELLRVSGHRAKELYKSWREFEKSNKGDIEDYKDSDNFRVINQKYDDALNKLRDAYGK